jgi:phosphatidylglycerol---prolipoprotein diacylglyceryl transferase
MTVLRSVITIGIDSTIEIGPITLAWHGLTIAIGIVVGGVVTAFDARRRGLVTERLYVIGLILVIGALVGARVFYLLEHGRLDDLGGWFGTTGFTFYGGFIAAALGIVYYVRREPLSPFYLDAVAAGLPRASQSGASATSSTVSTTGRRRTSSSGSATRTRTRSPRAPTSPTTPAASTRC